MKKLLLIPLLFVLCLFPFTACSEEEDTTAAWKNCFKVTYSHIDESVYDDPWDALQAMLDGVYIYEQDVWTVTNITNDVMKSVSAYFEMKVIGEDAFEYRKYFGELKQGESDSVNFYVPSTYELICEDNGIEFDENTYYTFNLVRIEYKIAT